jgi:hypothetical protein
LNALAAEYGQPAGTRFWNEAKVLSFKAYGAIDVSRLQITVSNSTATSEGNGAIFTDYSDLNHRSVISVELPASSIATGTSGVMSFAAGDVDVVDLYVEFTSAL